MRLLSFLILVMIVNRSTAQFKEAHAGAVTFYGEPGEAERLAVQRMFQEPFGSLAWLRADLTNETVSEHDKYNGSFHKWNRPFKFYSGDISGRYLELMSVLSAQNKEYHPVLHQFLNEFLRYQQPDGHFGWATINWNDSIDFKARTPNMMPVLRGNGRMFCGLVEAYKAFGDKELLQGACKLGDFYISIADRFMDTARIQEYRGVGTSADGYVTCYFNAMEGLVKLFQVNREQKYLALAERMAAFYGQFDVLPIGHTHGMLCNQYALLLLYEQTGKASYLQRVEHRWNAMLDSGYANPAGGVQEKSGNKMPYDEGCAESDWLRVNLKLFEITKNKRYLDMAERLLWNHYLINQHSSGGFGHRNMMNDSKGVFGFANYMAEATWCCDFHGTLGFQLLKPLLVTADSQELYINFPLSYKASLDINESTWNVTSEIEAGKMNDVILQQTLQLHNNKQKQTRLAVRVPDWATGITATNASGKTITFEPGQGYWRSKKMIRAGEIIKVNYHGKVVVEDRHCRPIIITAKEQYIGEVVLRYGPRLLMLKDFASVPSIIPDIDKKGNVVFTKDILNSGLLVKLASDDRPAALQPRVVRDDSTKSVFVFSINDR